MTSIGNKPTAFNPTLGLPLPAPSTNAANSTGQEPQGDTFATGGGTNAYGTTPRAGAPAGGPAVPVDPQNAQQLQDQVRFANLGGRGTVRARNVDVTSSTQVNNGRAQSAQSGNLTPTSGNVSSPGGASYTLNNVTVTQSVTNSTTNTTLGSGTTGTDRTSGVAVSIQSHGGNTLPGDSVRIAGSGNTPEAAIANAVSSSGVMSHRVQNSTTNVNTGGTLKETQHTVVQGQTLTPDQFPAGRPQSAGYTATSTGTSQSRNQVAADVLAPYPKGTGVALPNGQPVAFTPGVDGKGRETQAAKDYTALAKATGVAPNARDLNSTREALNANYGTGISADKNRIGAQYVTGLQDAVVQRYNNLANIGRDAAGVVDHKGQVVPEKLAAFKQQYANNPEAGALLEKAGIKGGMAGFDGSLAQVGQLQRATLDEVRQLGAALNPTNPMANHPNLQALRREIDNVAGSRTILQPLTAEELANRVTRQQTSASTVDGAAQLHAVQAQVVEVKDPQTGSLSYYATGTATLAR